LRLAASFDRRAARFDRQPARLAAGATRTLCDRRREISYTHRASLFLDVSAEFNGIM
jgi:hypothetical protein